MDVVAIGGSGLAPGAALGIQSDPIVDRTTHAGESRGGGEHRAAGELPFALTEETVGIVERTHRAIAGRAFGLTRTSRTPVRLAHDGISRLTYASIKGATRASRLLIGASLDAALPPAAEMPLLSDSRAGAVAIAALNGWSGDRLERSRNPLRVQMGVRRRGREVPLDRAGLAAAYPRASGRIAIFAHGLMESEDVWWLGTKAPGGTRRPNYGERLQHDLGYTPVYLRYNSGLHVSDNGRRLARLLQRLVDAWPAEVREIAIFGHSMGGLVVRSANHDATRESLDYVRRVRHVVHSGSPNHGSRLEHLANRGSFALSLLPETRAFAELINTRSDGVKDMRFGNVLDEDWSDHDPDELMRDRRRQAPFLATATHYFIAATLTRDPGDPISRVLGDLLVVLPSAWAEDMHASGSRFEIDRSRSFGGITHFQLTSHPAIYEQIRTWLEPKALPARTP